MLSTSKTTNYWRRNALTRVRFLQRETPEKTERPAVSNDRTNAVKHHDKVVKELRKVERNYFLERRPFL